MGKQFIKSNYFYKQKDGFDKIILVTKDENGKKDFMLVERPTLEYYISKDYIDPKVEVRSIPIEDVNKYKCYYKNLYQDMVANLGDEELIGYYNSVINSPTKTGMNKKLSKIHLDNRFHNTDINIEDSYIGRFLNKYPAEENNFPLTKFFYDIEVDGSVIQGFPEAESAECEVNIISACMEEEDCIRMYMFCLNYTEDQNKSYYDFNSNLKPNVLEIKEHLKTKLKKAKIEKDIKFTIKRFNNEINLIKEFFNVINDKKPDYVLGWNTARFDFPYLYNRLAILTANTNETIESIMCPKEFPYKSVKYRIDNEHPDAPDNNSTMNVSSYSVHIDQQNLYGNLRKQKGKLESYSLDAISEIELGEHKEELTTNIKTQHFDDYYEFFKYSANDTLLLYLLENKGHDIEMLNAIATITKTRPEECLKKTICLRNLADSFYKENGRIISNNRSSLKHKDGKPRGAFVAPMTLVDNMGMELFEGAGLSKYLFEEVCDLDLSSLYPSIILALNLAPETFIMKLCITKTNENYEVINVEDVFVDEYIAKDYVFLGEKYLGMPNIEDLIDGFDENEDYEIAS